MMPFEWLSARKQDVRSLTGQDRCALFALDACWQLYANSDEAGGRAALLAVRVLLPVLEPRYWPLAKELIARAMGPSDREPLWRLVVPPGGGQ